MTALALIRHGEYAQLAQTPSALQPFPLTSKGVEDVRYQARQFGRWLAVSGYQLSTEIHCSTLLRAWQTAEIYREELATVCTGRLITRSFSALCERSVGAVANLSVKEIERIVALDPRLDALPKGWKSSSDFKLPFEGAESLMEAGKRVAGHLSTLLERHAFQDTDQRLQIIVGHGASIRHACHHLKVITFSEIQRLSMFYGQPVVFEHKDDDWRRLYGHWKHRRTVGPID